LRAAGLSDLEVLDLIHAIAMFANANRLMQSLGRSVPPSVGFACL
jgi:alkylhydroperoxidase family enzyme